VHLQRTSVLCVRDATGRRVIVQSVELSEPGRERVSMVSGRGAPPFHVGHTFAHQTDEHEMPIATVGEGLTQREATMTVEINGDTRFLVCSLSTGDSTGRQSNARIVSHRIPFHAVFPPVVA
jgi:hypothetical protein